MGSRIVKSLPAVILVLFAARPCFPANIAVPTLELITRGVMDDGVFGLATRGEIDLRIEGGYKFGGLLAFTYASNTLEEDPEGRGLTFETAAVAIRQIFATPLNFTFFVGQSDVLCSGAGFTDTFGTASFATQYSGYMYFPDGVLYDGIARVKGTGIKLDYTPAMEWLLLSLYAYQDSHFTSGGFLVPGYYSIDADAMANFDAVRIEGFAGVTLSTYSLYGYYRGGALFHASNDNVEFLAQIGIPKFDPATNATFSIDLFYLLFEPRLHLGLLSIIPTFFWHPGSYLQATTGETGSFDINLNLYLGDEVSTPVRGGLEANFRFDKAEGAFTIKASPYAGFTTRGVIWDFKCGVKLWPFDLANLIDAFIGLRAEF